MIELMIVAAIIGLLAAIAIPKFSDMVIRAREAAVMGKLGALRSTISIYYSDNEGYFPEYVSFFDSPLTPRYIDEIPIISIPTVPAHLPGNAETGNFVGDFAGTPVLAYAYDWNTGLLRVGCTHRDSKGVVWTTK